MLFVELWCCHVRVVVIFDDVSFRASGEGNNFCAAVEMVMVL